MSQSPSTTVLGVRVPESQGPGSQCLRVPGLRILGLRVLGSGVSSLRVPVPGRRS